VKEESTSLKCTIPGCRRIILEMHPTALSLAAWDTSGWKAHVNLLKQKL
jgi:hypothetical protein